MNIKFLRKYTQTDFDVPRDVATCPSCDGQLEIDVYEFEIESMIPTEYGFHWWCKNFLSDSKNGCDESHCSYEDGINIGRDIYEWAKENVSCAEIVEYFQEGNEKVNIIIVEKSDVDDLILCNSIAPLGWRHKKLFYALKGMLLDVYATPDGYDLQEWHKYDHDSDCWTMDICTCKPSCGIYATHSHILKRYLLLGHIFHCPTSEYCYWVNGSRFDKKSAGYAYFAGIAKNTIYGKKRTELMFGKIDNYAEVSGKAYRALKRLIKKFGFCVQAVRGGYEPVRFHDPEPAQATQVQNELFV